MSQRLPGIVAASLWMFGLALAQNAEPATVDASKESFWGIYLLIPLPFMIIGLIAFLLYRSETKRRRRKPQWVE